MTNRKQQHQALEFVQNKSEKKKTGIQKKKKKNPREGSFRRPPLAVFGVDGARSLADDTTAVRGTGVRPWGADGARAQKVVSGIYILI